MWKPREGDKAASRLLDRADELELRDLIDEVDAPVVPSLPGAR